jgi:putative Mg2+ transporter-C (MgtC) family protein
MSIDVQTQLELSIRLLLAIVLGGLVGFNRERGGHAAGLGTFSLVTLGACVFSIVSDLVFVAQADNTRIASGIVEGIGFLGAGIILTGRRSVHGLTTAAALWATASVGMLVGYGLYVLAFATTLAVYIVLSVRHIGPVSRSIRSIREDTEPGTGGTDAE